METTAAEKNDIRTIIHKLIDGDQDWLKKQGIVVGDKNPYWIVNYQLGGRNDYNRLVRGMVIQKPQPNFHGDLLSLIRSFPFTRFYNQGESDAAHVDFANAEMLEKLDGTMVGVFFPNGDPQKPEFHTRKMLSTHQPDMNLLVTTFHGKEAVLLPMIKQYLNQLRFSEKDVANTYVFEFVHDEMQVLTKYKPAQYGLYLLGARNISTHLEMTEDELDHAAQVIGAKRPRRFQLSKMAGHDEILKMFKLASVETPDFEGFVVRDKKTGNRIKVKDPDYVEKHHLLGELTYRKLLPRYLEGEAEEIMAYFPHAKIMLKQIETAYNSYVDKITAIVQKWQAKGLGKRDLSVALHGEEPLKKWERRLNQIRGIENKTLKPAEEDTFAASMISKYSNIKDSDKLREKIDGKLREIALGQGHNDGSPKNVIQMIGLKNQPEDDDETGAI